jgi:hypothetical protein
MPALPGRYHGAADHAFATWARALDAAVQELRPRPSNAGCIQPVAIRTARMVREKSGLTEMRSDKRNRKKTVFLTADQLEELADARAREARQLPDGEARQNALRDAAQLRVYATMKRALTPQDAKLK